MRLHRFYLKQPLGEEIVVEDEEMVKQWFSVFRYHEGDRVILFEGDGFDNEYEIKEKRKGITTLVRKGRRESIVPKKDITVALSLIKKNNFEFAVEKGVEIGVSRFIPIVSERSEKKNLNIDRIRKIAIEATEQSGRGDLPYVADISTIDDVSKNPPKNIVILDGRAEKSLDELRGSDELTLFVGPEGGFTDHDIEKLVSLGGIKAKISDTVLRAETAAIVAPAILLHS